MKIEYSWQSTPHLWHAYDADTSDGAPDSAEPAHMVGAGHTKEDALEDLIEQLDDYWRRECDKAASCISNAKSELERERAEHRQWTIDHQRDTDSAWRKVNAAEAERGRAMDECERLRGYAEGLKAALTWIYWNVESHPDVIAEVENRCLAALDSPHQMSGSRPDEIDRELDTLIDRLGKPLPASVSDDAEAARIIGQVDRRDAARYRWIRATGGPVFECAGAALDEVADAGIDAILRKIPGSIDPRTGNEFAVNTETKGE